MAYSDEDIEKIFDSVLERIEEGEALRNILKDDVMPSSRTFFKWLAEDEIKVKRYAQACEVRADNLFEEILQIADDSSEDAIVSEHGIALNKEFVARSRLRYDARRWMIGKLNPKKYGDKIQQDITTQGEKIQANAKISISLPDGTVIDDFKLD